MRITQPVQIQSFKDEFKLPMEKDKPKILAEAGQVLVRPKMGEGLADEDQSVHMSGVGKLLHVMRWSRPDILNAVHELSKHMTSATQEHMKAMYRVMNYCVTTESRGIVLKPNRKWNGLPSQEFEISGAADSTYASCPDTKRSVGGQTTFVEGVPVVVRSRMQKVVALSTTEAELMSGTECAQDMLYTMRLIESIGLKVKKPMVLEIDNKGAVDIANNWSVGG